MARWRPTKKQLRVYSDGGVPEENKAREWLEARGFRIIEAFHHRHSEAYDIIVAKGAIRWVIEVKSGVRPGISIPNIIEMIGMTGIDRIGLLFVPEKKGIPILFEQQNELCWTQGVEDTENFLRQWHIHIWNKIHSVAVSRLFIMNPLCDASEVQER